ncbi:uncharacterized protein N7503_011025 [Penicillium pulvis]|uniref:uncharacterized protein n=1 Tax=Penicillium pulvis TaxID=1562058 RepID=UPI00254832BF|nr:uncharacterized protein N7503_011025 [Penicillium pulvis]KAJ5785813.1 hypothetical protein N7503_011025 [Penicillium pulvis]
MVTSSIDANPLDPDTMYKYGQNTQQAPPKSDLDVIMDRNVAPSPREVCADLAHQHALEDLHDVTEHASEKHDPMDHNLSSSRRSSDRGTQCDEPRKPEE